jgi:Domain of unknown function (DUF4403)
MSNRTIIIGAIAVVVVSFLGATFLINLLWPSSLQEGRPQLVAAPPLKPLAGKSTILAPATVAMSAIHDALEAQAPHNLSGKPQNPVSQLLQSADLSFTVTRGPLNVSGRPEALVVSTHLSGTFDARGTITGAANAVGGAISGLIGGQQMQNLVGKAFVQHGDLQGTVTAVSRPTISPNWRLSPNLSAQVNVADVVLPIGGVKLSVAGTVKPVLDNAVREQTAVVEARVRNDPFIENAARAEWAKLCHATSLGIAAPGAPNLWLEVRPTRAIAAQPEIGSNAVTLFLGVEAQTRIVPNETRPTCPFPQQLDILPQANEGTLDITVPIDVPFTDVSRLVETQLGGKTFPEDGSGSYVTTIKRVAIAASGDRLLISLLVNVKRRGWFSIGADATLHVWGRPLLDQGQQILRFTDVSVDVQSKTAFELLGVAAQAAVPYLQKMLAEKAVVDLKPFGQDAKKQIAAAVNEFTGRAAGMSVNVAITSIRLTGVDYDDNTLRIIADADGTVNVAISSLALQ